jgi:hypothetical protein
MTRAERQSLARQRRIKYSLQILDFLQQAYLLHKDWSQATEDGDRYIQQLCKAHPQEKSLIIAAARVVAAKLQEGINVELARTADGSNGTAG